MPINRTILFASINELKLDPWNPRLGRRLTGANVSQEKILSEMRSWTLDELAVSFIENGFWPQEALLCVREPLYGEPALVVVEGNRRLAALIYLRDALAGNPFSRKWQDIARDARPPEDLFARIPYMLADSRSDIDTFLGFRHVTGIKEWSPAEKAEYIAKLIDERGMSYQQVMRAIGSKTETVRRNYIAYRILRQMEDLEEQISLSHVEDKFSVLFLSLRESGVQEYLGVDIRAEPRDAASPVPPDRLADLADYARWVFGTDKSDPLLTDSRNISKLGRVLKSDAAVKYLRTTDRPVFDVAMQKAGADEPELVERVMRATDEIEQTLSRAHLYRDSPDLAVAVNRFGKGAVELLRKFPDIWNALKKDGF